MTYSRDSYTDFRGLLGSIEDFSAFIGAAAHHCCSGCGSHGGVSEGKGLAWARL